MNEGGAGDALIEVAGVEKVFSVRRKVGRLRRVREEVRAVAGLDFTVARGEMVGYIGPNGAGKSTTIKMLTGILMPSAGRLRVAGIDPFARSGAGGAAGDAYASPAASASSSASAPPSGGTCR